MNPHPPFITSHPCIFCVAGGLLKERQTPLTQALAFLHTSYEPRWYLWELMEVGKKLFLVGFLAVILPGTLMQLVIGLVFTLAFTLLDGVVSPHKLREDDYFSLVANFALSSVFAFCIVLKTGTLATSVDEVMTDHLRDVFDFYPVTVSIGLMAAMLTALILVS